MTNQTPEIIVNGAERQSPWVISIERPVPTFAGLYLTEFLRATKMNTPEIRRPSGEIVRECGSEDEYNGLVHDLLVTRVIENARAFERPNAGWQSHRRATTDRLTGFEPYFIGSGLDSDKIANHIGTFFNDFIDAYRKGHQDYTGPDLFWQMKALLRGQIAPERRGGITVRGVGLMDYILNEMLHNYRSWMSRDAKTHREEMQRRLSVLSNFTYKSTGGQLIEQEAHGIVQVPMKPELSSPAGAAYRDNQDLDNPYIFVKHFLGQVGDPVIRGIQHSWRNTNDLGLPTTARDTAKLLETRSQWSKVPFSVSGK